MRKNARPALFSDRATSLRVSDLVCRLSEELNASVVDLNGKIDPDEYSRYRTAVGKAMGSMFVEILEPIWEKFPDVAPAELRHQYVRDKGD